MDPVTVGAVLLAVVSGAAGAVGTQLWSGVGALVRRPFRGRSAERGAVSALPAGDAEFAALEEYPADERRAVALAEVLVARAGANAEFGQELEAWWALASPVRNTISGGIQFGPVLRAGRYIQATFQAAAPAPVALAQLPPLTAGFTGRDAELAVMTGL